MENIHFQKTSLDQKDFQEPNPPQTTNYPKLTRLHRTEESDNHDITKKGYIKAKQLLKGHYGNEIKISSAYLEKALSWTAIKSDDGEALHAYAMYLRGCCNAMQDLQHMEELDISSNLKSIASKLPYKLCERWQAVAYDVMQRTNRRA